jgi:simple sugar transport system ATP-binding protein
VLLISADLDELRKLAARILVLARGRIVAELPPTASDDELGRSMLGLTGNESAGGDSKQPDGAGPNA